MYKIKEIPKDFLVKEIPDYELDESGQYSYFWLTKTNYTTMNAVKTIAAALNIPLKFIGFAGTKDKRAITKQTISIKAPKEKVETLNLKDIKLGYIGQGSKPISLGDLKANEFVITVRNLITRRLQHGEIIPNLFGPQRFSKNNAEIGRALVKRDFETAMNLIDQAEVKQHLENFPGDFIGALRKIPLKIRKIYIHAYQSLLWNKTVQEFTKIHRSRNMKIPIIGFGTDIDSIEDPDLKQIINSLLEQEEITTRDFIMPAIKELSAEGSQRNLFVIPKKIEIITEKDELNENKLKTIVSFSLPKGSYATVVIDYFF
ncbi:tRNA pseudouridine(13) synthase TruD [Candidatus Woesearchaeota archaeon]|nr:tRNA pseudouridine(13) synthase TruD [Candidatus Woesearchaeota archaeon]